MKGLLKVCRTAGFSRQGFAAGDPLIDGVAVVGAQAIRRQEDIVFAPVQRKRDAGGIEVVPHPLVVPRVFAC